MARYARRKNSSRSGGRYGSRRVGSGNSVRRKSGTRRRSPARRSSGPQRVRIELITTTASPVSRPDVLKVEDTRSQKRRF